MEKLNRIAVFLHGHPRTWKYTKDHLFNFFDSIANEVEYFVAFWKTTNRNTWELKKDFDGRTLCEYLICDNHWNYDAWTGPTHLSNLLEPIRVKQELLNKQVTNQYYDLVIDTRPDVVFSLIGDPQWPTENDVAVSKVVKNPNPIWHGMQDTFFITSSRGHIILNQRQKYDSRHDYLIDLPSSHHSKLLYFCELYGLNPIETSNWLRCDMVRPNIVDIPFPEGSVVTNHATNLFYKWIELDIHQKIDCLNRAGIELDEYLQKFLIPN